MNTLELSNYGVQEMDAGEIRHINGGVDGNEFCLDPETHKELAKKALKGIKDAWDYVRGFGKGFLGL